RMDLRERAGEDGPRAARLPAEQRADGLELLRTGAIVEDGLDFAVAFVDRARPLAGGGKAQAVHLDVSEVSLLDVPGPGALAEALGRGGVEVAGTAPVAVTGLDEGSSQLPVGDSCTCHGDTPFRISAVSATQPHMSPRFSPYLRHVFARSRGRCTVQSWHGYEGAVSSSAYATACST